MLLLARQRLKTLAVVQFRSAAGGDARPQEPFGATRGLALNRTRLRRRQVPLSAISAVTTEGHHPPASSREADDVRRGDHPVDAAAAGLRRVGNMLPQLNGRLVTLAEVERDDGVLEPASPSDSYA